MDRYEQEERGRAAQRRQATQRRRVGTLRRRVVAISLIVFVLFWAVVITQMAAGHDPVLSRSGGQSSGSQPTAPVRAAVETTDPEETEIETVEVEPVEEEAFELEPEPAPVTTSQS